MKFVLSFIFIIFLFSFKTFLFAQSNRLKLKRVNPSGWFSLLVPQNNDGFLPHGSVDGGDFDSNEMEVEFNYWQNGNVPLYVKNTIDANSKPPILVCLDKLQTKTWNALINSKKAIAQTCFDYKNSEFLYHVTFPSLRVFEVESGKFGYGRFNLTIIYKNKIHKSIARKIANSIRFKN